MDRKFGQYWVEPFVGGGNMIDKVSGNRIGADSNRYTIEALISIRDFVYELPKNNLEFTEDDYNKLKIDDSYKHKGFAGFSYSYGAKWLGGWSRNGTNKRDYVAESYRNALKQSPNLQGVELLNKKFDELIIPENSIIYCDPPYFNSNCGHYDGYTESDFRELLDTLASIKGKFILSSYPSQILKEYCKKHNYHSTKY